MKGVKIKAPNFSNFSLADLDRLKNDEKWLSDSHVTLGVRLVSLFILFYLHVKCNRDSFLQCASRNIWGNLRIKLFDTSLWNMLSNNPGRYHGRFLEKNNFLDCDFAIIPMFKK